MTRAWDSHRRSALGVKKHTGLQSLGPSDIPYAYNTSGATAGNHRLALNAKLYVGKQGLGSETFTTYSCYTNLGGCSGVPPDLTDDRTAVRVFAFLQPWREFYGDIDDLEIDGTLIGIYAHDPNTGFYHCYENYRATVKTSFGDNVRIPRDSLDDVLYIVCTHNAAAEADRTTGGIGSCAAGWFPTTPPGTLVHRPIAQSVASSYSVLYRADVDSAWSFLVTAADLPSGGGASGVWMINQSTGMLWWQDSTTTLKVWPIGTRYTSASPTTVTAVAGTINWIAAWGATTFVKVSTGDIYYYHGTTYGGVLGAPLNPSTWDWASIAFGWLALTDDGTVHFWRVADDSVTFSQSLEGSVDSAQPCAEDYCIARSAGGVQPFQRLMYDHGTGLWENIGGVPHLEAADDDGYTYWFDTIHRHVVLRKPSGASYIFQLMEVC